VRIGHGEPAKWEPTLSVSGTLTPIRESELNFKVAGRLTSVRVKVGDVVKAGELLAQLDASDLAAQLKAAQAQVHSTEVALFIAKDEETRSEALSKQGAISGAQLRADQSRAAMAKANLETAQAQAATVSAALENTRLVAPFGGLVTVAPSAPGAVINPNVPGAAFMRIEDTTSLRFTGTISPEDAALARVGTAIEVEGTAGHVARGTITAVLPSVDPQTRRVPVHAELKNDPSAPLLAGIFARATVRAAGAVDVVKLPAEALRPGSQDEVVVVEGGRARIARITFTRADDGSLLVREGVRAADAVVLGPSASVKNGDAIASAQ
jgi:RND family efflux transporter MFP subunit